MEYLKPFTYFAGATGGFANTLLCAICNLIPIVGQIVLLGYRAEVAEELLRDRRLRRHPAFDFNRFGDYLSRGLWPFLYQVLVGAVGAAFIFGFVILIGVAVAAAAGPKPDPAVVLAVVLGGYALAYIGFITFLVFVLLPMELHGQITREFAPVAAFGFAARLQQKVWGQTLVTLVVLVAGGFVLGVVGLLACYFGIFLTMVVQMMAQQHLMTQLYRLYLDEGGEPVYGPDDFDDEYDD